MTFANLHVLNFFTFLFPTFRCLYEHQLYVVQQTLHFLVYDIETNLKELSWCLEKACDKYC